MRNPDARFAASLVSAPETGIAPRKFVWITAKIRDTQTPVSIGLWSGDSTEDFEVISGTTGLPVTRTYIGAGSLISVGNIPLVSDLTIQTVSIELSQIATGPQVAVRGYDARFAEVEVHDGLLSPDTGKLTSPPEIVFIGEVDGSPIETPSVGGEGSITLECVSSAMRMLTRTNPRKRSYEAQLRRLALDNVPDGFGRYAGAVANWVVQWGSATT